MKEIELNAWSEFTNALATVRSEVERYREAFRTVMQANMGGNWSEDLLSRPSRTHFRGQPDASWHLTSTLERDTQRERTRIRDYLRTILSLKPQIEVYTGDSWPMTYVDIDEVAKSLCVRQIPKPVHVYEYMAYLRHHGFPSPLVDWSYSPYVAAYFAFDRLPPEGVDKVSVFAYVETIGAGKGGMENDPSIVSLGHTIRAHRRHFVQRSVYTCCFNTPEGADWRDGEYWSHEDPFRREDPEQDLLFKINIPAGERANALRYLDEHNISKHSLFDTTETLMESLALREYGLEAPDRSGS